MTLLEQPVTVDGPATATPVVVTTAPPPYQVSMKIWFVSI